MKERERVVDVVSIGVFTESYRDYGKAVRVRIKGIMVDLEVPSLLVVADLVVIVVVVSMRANQ